jgi:hypothetical protein
MNADLLDAQAAWQWADTQIPLLQQGFLDWVKANPYRIVHEPDADSGGNAAVVYDQPFPLMFNVWVGLIINAFRSSLDLIAAALARRNGKNPNGPKFHFPIYRDIAAYNDPDRGIESKKWLSDRERAAIKAFKPYGGGDEALWPLHRLDVLRKHQRLITAKPVIAGAITYGLGQRSMRITGTRKIERLENKTVLERAKRGESLAVTQDNTRLAPFVTFNEPSVGLVDCEVAFVLKEWFSMRARDILSEIDRL